MSLEAVPYEFEFGGAEKTTITLAGATWDAIRRAFAGVSDPRSERLAVGQSIARCEQAGGEQTPSWRDLPRSEATPGKPGQLDCIAESDNTTTFLLVLRQEGLLRFHEVLTPRRRSRLALFYSHRSALLRERSSGVVFAVDSWVGRNGDEPLIQEYEAWLRMENAGANGLDSSARRH